MIYISDLPLRIDSLSEPILYADDTSVIISNRSFEDFCSVSNVVLSHMIECFSANNLVVNLGKTNIMNLSHSTLHVDYKEKHIEEAENTTFLGLQIDNHINWKNHIEEMIPKLSRAY
jgi:hypothetical protein